MKTNPISNGMNKKALIGIIVGILAGLLIITGLYFIFLSPKNNPGGNGIGLNSFFPIGGNVNNNVNNNNNIDGVPLGGVIGENLILIPKLRKISSGPVAGFFTFDRRATTTLSNSTSTRITSTTTEIVIRYIEKATGHIYETTNNTLISARLSNTTFTKIHEAKFLNQRSLVLRRYDSNTASIETYLASLIPVPATSTTNFELQGTFLPRNISQVATFGNKIFNLYTSLNGSSGFLINPAGSKEVAVFSSPLSGWNIEWVNENQLVFQTKPSEGEEGYGFLFNPQTGATSQLLGPEGGLTMKVNNDASSVLYSTHRKNTFILFYKNLKENNGLQLLTKTFPEKCVWSRIQKTSAYCGVPQNLPSAKYPDDWYKGIISFSDNILKFEADIFKEATILNLQTESGEIIDAINLSLSPKEDYLFFINKRDGSLWSYDVRP